LQRCAFFKLVPSVCGYGDASLLTYTPLIWLPILATAGAAALYVYSRRYPDVPETRYLQFLIIITAAWSVLEAVDLSFTDMESKVWLTRLRFLFAPFVSVTLFCLMMTHCGRGSWITPLRFALLCVVPLLTLVLAETGDLHDLFLTAPTMGEGEAMVRFETGPWYWVYLSYALGLMFASFILVIDSMRGASRLYRKQSVVLLFAFLPTALYDFTDNFRLLQPMSVDLTPVMFIITGTILAWGLYRYRILDVKPIARGEVVEHMTDAYLVVSPDGKIVDYNTVAGDLMVQQGRDAIGHGITEMLPFGTDIVNMITWGKSKGDVAVSGSSKRYYEASIMPVTVRSEEVAHVVLLRDISDRKNMEEALRTANYRLGLLSTIMRHDLQNKLTAINGYSMLARRASDSEKADKFLMRLDQVSASASEMIKAAKEQESLGLKPPTWYAVDDLFANAARQMNLENVKVRSTVGGVSVFADPMIEKVFYNLLDNSMRHGENVTSISLERRETDDGLVIEYSDDGVGVPPENKERIFERGFGSNTGLGMYLIREILMITGITIEERGTRGARFELKVPHGRYRFAT